MLALTEHLNPEADVALGVRQGEGAVSAFSPTTVVVPVPPSVNKMFRNVPGKGRCRTKLYDTWKHEAGWRLRAQKPAHVAGQVLLLIAVERSWDMADIDNRTKALLDLLVTHKVIEDDSKVVGFCIAWAPMREDDARLLIFPAMNCTVQFELAPDGKSGGFYLLTDAQPQGDA